MQKLWRDWRDFFVCQLFVLASVMTLALITDMSLWTAILLAELGWLARGWMYVVQDRKMLLELERREASLE